MSDNEDYIVITGKVQKAEDITGIPGLKTFRGQDARGIYYYPAKLNQLAELEQVELLDPPPEATMYDYIVKGSGGILVRADWVDGPPNNIQSTIDWASLPEGTEVEVSNDEDTWFKMHFATYDPNDPNGRPYYVFGSGRSAYTAQDQWIEQISITVPDGISSVEGGEYFLLYSDDTKYYVWFNVDDEDTDPEITDHTGVEVTLTAGYSSNDTASAIHDAVSQLADFSSSLGTTTVTITVQDSGKVYDATKGTTELHIVITKQGGDVINYPYARLP